MVNIQHSMQSVVNVFKGTGSEENVEVGWEFG
jgi:hypothetical protein